MISFVELIDTRCPGCGQTISPLELIIGDDGQVRHETQEDEWGGHLLPLEGLRAQLDAEMTNRVTNRESGGSRPASPPAPACCVEAFNACTVAEPPLLNKSGGSQRQRCEAELKDHFEHCPTPRCGQDGRESMCAAAAAIYGRYLAVLWVGG